MRSRTVAVFTWGLALHAGCGIDQLTDGENFWPSNRIQPQPREPVDDAAICAAWKEPATPTEGALLRQPCASHVPQAWLVVRGDVPDGEARASFVHQCVVADRDPPRAGDRLPWCDGRWERAVTQSNGAVPGPISFATSSVVVSETAVYMAKLAGADRLFVNGECFQGDPENRGFEGVPVLLHAGANTIYVTDAAHDFRLEFWRPATRAVIATWDVWIPRRLYEIPELLSAFSTISIPVFNASPRPAAAVHLDYGGARADGRAMSTGYGFACRPETGPLCLAAGYVMTFAIDDTAENSTADVFAAPVAAGLHDGTPEDRRILRFRGRPLDIRERPARTIEWSKLAECLGSPLGTPWGGEEDREGVLQSVFVYGTAGPPESDAALLALARFWQQRLWYYGDIVPQVVSDAVYLEQVAAGSPPIGRVMAFGDRTSNSLLTPLSEDFDREFHHDGRLTVIVDLTDYAAASDHLDSFGAVVCPDLAAAALGFAIDPFFDPPHGGWFCGNQQSFESPDSKGN